MQFALRKKFLALPLRIKLTLWNTLVMLVFAAIALIAVREGLRRMLEKELAVALDDEMYEITVATHHAHRAPQEIFREIEKTSAGHLRHGWFMQLFSPDGQQLVWSSDRTPRWLIDEPGPVQPLVRRDGLDYCFAEGSLLAGQSPLYLLRIGTSLEFVRRDIDKVTRIIVPVLLAVMLLAPIGGYVLAGRATAPLQQIIAMSRKLHPSRMSERLPLRDVGDELDQLSAEINDFLDQIAGHLRRNREFVANAAHELRSPLAALMTSVDVTLSRERTADEYREELTMVHGECRQLTGLVNQLLLLAESDAGLLAHNIVPVTLATVVRSSLEMFEGLLEDKELRMHVTLDPTAMVLGDGMRLRQVVNNLLDNAIKFTPPGGSIKVTVRRLLALNQVELVVRDSGVGIPKEAVQSVFERFYQVETSRHHEHVVHGTGLGLSICQSIVLAYGGQIHCRSDTGQGATFVVRLPAGSPKVGLFAAPQTPAPATSQEAPTP